MRDQIKENLGNIPAAIFEPADYGILGGGCKEEIPGETLKIFQTKTETQIGKPAGNQHQNTAPGHQPFVAQQEHYGLREMNPVDRRRCCFLS